MKRALSVFLCLLLVCLLTVPVLAAPAEPVITMQPQSPNYPNYSVAMYTVKVSGTNLSAIWYMDWQGTTYTISDIGGSMQAWEPYAGEAYGARKLDSNTFSFIFEGIEEELNGASIWCVIEDGHYSITSQKAQVMVGNSSTPPTIVSIPAGLTVKQGEAAEIRCVCQAPAGTQLSYVWYETHTGRLQDIQAINRGTETSDYLFCDTNSTGTRYYVCMIETSAGGVAYSSVVPVTVTENPQADPLPEITTKSLPEAEAGTAYSAQLRCSDPNAEFSIFYNPGKANDFNKTGLTLSNSGLISGTPTAAGSYGFCVCAAGAGGEDYMVYTLTVREAEKQEVTEPTEPEETTEPTTSTEPSKPADTSPAETKPASTDPAESTPGVPTTGSTPDSNAKTFPWLVVGLIVAAVLGIAVVAVVCVVVIILVVKLIKKKKKA